MHNQNFTSTPLGIIVLGAIGSLLAAVAWELYKWFIQPHIRDIWSTVATAYARRSRSRATKRREKLTRQLSRIDNYRKHPAKLFIFALERLLSFFGLLLVGAIGITMLSMVGLGLLVQGVSLILAFLGLLLIVPPLVVVRRVLSYDEYYKEQMTGQIARLEQAIGPRSVPPPTSEGSDS